MGMADKCAYAAGMIRKHGIRGLFWKYIERRRDPVDREYAKHWQEYFITTEEWKIQRNTRFDDMPLISVVVPAYETPKEFLVALVESLQVQSYENWELCIADGSPSEQVAKLVRELSRDEERIRYQHLSHNGGISENTNAGLAMAQGAYVGLLDHDDTLAANALYEVVRLINARPGADVIYSDEDKIDVTGKLHSRPHFKLDYNRELLLHYNYICHFLVVRKALLDQTGGLRSEYNGAQDYDLVLRLAELTDEIHHISKILYHWRVHRNSTAGSSLSKDYAYDAGRRALEDCVERRQLQAKVRKVSGGSYYEVMYTDQPASMEEIDLQSISHDKTLQQAAAGSSAPYLLLWDSKHVHAPSEREKREMLLLCMQRNIGLVGVRYRKRGRLLSAGIRALPKGGYNYEFSGLPIHFKGYFDRGVIRQNVDAVPLECCVVRREAFLAALAPEEKLHTLEGAAAFGRRMQAAGYEVVLDARVTVKYKG